MQMLASQDLESLGRDERRRYLRYALRCECWLESEGESLFATTADVGLGGLFLRTAVPMDLGQRVRIALCMKPDRESVEMQGLVTRTVPARHGHRHGIGVQFVELGDTRDGLRRFLTSR
jgi:hypothetical protein